LKIVEKVTSVLLFAFAIFIMLGARKYPLGAIDNPGPGFLPFLLGLALGGMSIALFIRNWKKKDSQPEVTRPEGRGWIKVSSIFLMLLLFTLFFEITGYIVNVFLFFLVLLRPIGRQKWSWSLSISIGAASISYVLFERWLMLPLPRGIWFQ
jgi:putative tricarboxylic transport membrane protein